MSDLSFLGLPDDDPVELARDASSSLQNARKEVLESGTQDFLFNSKSLEEFDQRALIREVDASISKVASVHLDGNKEKLLDTLKQHYAWSKFKKRAGTCSNCGKDNQLLVQKDGDWNCVGCASSLEDVVLPSKGLEEDKANAKPVRIAQQAVEDEGPEADDLVDDELANSGLYEECPVCGQPAFETHGTAEDGDSVWVHEDEDLPDHVDEGIVGDGEFGTWNNLDDEGFDGENIKGTRLASDVTVPIEEATVDAPPSAPLSLIIDHKAELAEGVNPATCRVCGNEIQLHSQINPTKQQS